MLIIVQVMRYDAYDGAPFTEESTSGAVRYVDLTLPQYWLPRYDWVLCLEVIEHIPRSHEAVVLENVVRPAAEGVVLRYGTGTVFLCTFTAEPIGQLSLASLRGR